MKNMLSPELPGANEPTGPAPELTQSTVPPPTELDVLGDIWEDMRIERRNMLLARRTPEREFEVSVGIQRLANLNAIVRLALLQMKAQG